MSPDPDGLFILTAALTLLCLAAASIYAAGEAAVDFLSQAQIKKEAEEGDAHAKKLLKLTDWQKAAVSPLQTGMLLFGLLGLGLFLYTFGGLAEELLSPIAHEGGRGLLAYFLLSILYFLVFFLFGDLLPKKSARHNARAFAQRFVGLLCFLQAVAFPFLKLCALIVNGILRLCRIDPPHSG